jgi:hypothetical protein
MDEELKRQQEALVAAGLMSPLAVVPPTPAVPAAGIPPEQDVQVLPDGALMNVGGLSLPIDQTQPELGITKTYTPMTPGLEQAIVGQQAAAANASAGLEQAINQRSTASSDLQAQTLEAGKLEEQSLREEADLRKQFANELALQRTDIAKRQEELDKLQPQDFWADKSTGQKIGMALAVLAGSIGQGLSGAKENAAINALTQAMDNDSKLQESAYRRKVAGIQARREGIADTKAIQNDLLAQSVAMRNASLAKVNRQIEAAKLGIESADGLAKLEQLQANLNLQAAELNTKTEQALAGQVQEKGALINADGSVKPGVSKTKLDVGSAALSRELGARSGKLTTFLSDMRGLRQSLADPNMTNDQRVAALLASTKDMQSKYGPDAVTGSDEERVQGFLKPRIYQVLGAASQGIGYGTAAGAIIPAIGPVAGGIGGGIVKGITSALEQAEKPGGLSFRIDVPAAMKQLDYLIDRTDLSLKRSSLVDQGLRGGLRVETANSMADKLMGADAKRLQILQQGPESPNITGKVAAQVSENESKKERLNRYPDSALSPLQREIKKRLN